MYFLQHNVIHIPRQQIKKILNTKIKLIYDIKFVTEFFDLSITEFISAVEFVGTNVDSNDGSIVGPIVGPNIGSNVGCSVGCSVGLVQYYNF